tara:strand:+ start:64 stop:681 length:618 start_codon:yes stop_codon:yes gene_type:complete
MIRNSIWKYTLDCHSEIKSDLLKFIDDYKQINPNPYKNDCIFKTDFYDKTRKFNIGEYNGNNKENYYYMYPEYFEFFKEKLGPLWNKICHKYWLTNINIAGAWFQQYKDNGYHGWHLHGGSNISISYLLELDDMKYSTEFVDTERKDSFQLKCQEGDVIIFPSYIIHRSPLIRSDTRKTIIAANVDFINVDLIKINSIDPILNYE